LQKGARRGDLSARDSERQRSNVFKIIISGGFSESETVDLETPFGGGKLRSLPANEQSTRFEATRVPLGILSGIKNEGCLRFVIDL
jgi:hypothetical protein